MIIYEIIQYGLILLCGLLVGYQLMLGVAAARSDIEHGQLCSKHNTFLVLIPTLNGNEQALAKTLYSLSGLVYPKNAVQLAVITDHSHTESAIIAHKMGVEVWQWPEANGKKMELNSAKDFFALMGEREHQFDAAVIIQPNSLVSGDFLEIMNYHLQIGSDVIQSSNLLAGGDKSVKAKLSRVGSLFSNYLNPLGRRELGSDIRLLGSGMCFRKRILSQNPIAFTELMTGARYGLSLSLKNISIDFAPEARVWSTLSIENNDDIFGNDSYKGKFSLFKEYFRPLINQFITTRSWRTLDILAELITPPLRLFIGVTVAILIVNTLLNQLGYLSAAYVWIWLALLIMELSVLAIGNVALKRIDPAFNIKLEFFPKKRG